MVNQQDIRTRRNFEFEKARVFLLLPYLCFFLQISENVPIFLRFFARQRLFMFSLTILRGEIGARVARMDFFAHAQRLTIATEAKLNS